MGIRKRLSKIRNLAITLIVLGFVIMYSGVYFNKHAILMTLCIIFGGFLLIVSALFYTWIGLLSINSIVVTCPTCGKKTKMLGKVDKCTHCNEALTLEKELEGIEYSEKYNSNKPIKTES